MSKYTAALLCFGLVILLTNHDFNWGNAIVALSLIIVGTLELFR